MADESPRRRICVISSGNVRVIQPGTGILVKQLRAAGHAVDFHGLWWDDSDLDAARAALGELDSLTFWTTQRVNFQDDLSAFPKPAETVIHNFLSMAWSRLQLRRRLREEGVFERHDLFVFARLDSCYDRPLDYAAIDRVLASNHVALPRNGHWRDGWNDQFCAARGPAMDVYLSLFEHVRGCLEQGALLHPETLLRHHMERHGAQRGLLDMVNYLWRSDTVFRLG